MLLHCPGKKCNTNREHKIKLSDKDKHDGDVYCMDCGEINNSITSFAKLMMIQNKEILKVSKKKSFVFHCLKCQMEVESLLFNEKVCCKQCKEPLNITPQMAQIVMENLDNFKTAEEKQESKKKTKSKTIKKQEDNVVEIEVDDE